jgi:flagellar biosynthesis/type III secretory pathway M-ring protein FliF/YscJ
MPWNDTLIWTIIGLFSIMLAIMGWDTISRNIKERKNKEQKQKKEDKK